MAHHDPQRMSALLPELLGKVAKESGQARGLAVLWRQAVGDRIADAVRPISLRGGTLLLAAATPEWHREVAGRHADLLARVQAAVNAADIRALAFTVLPPSKGTDTA